ncbi:acyl-CoA reductase [Flavobacterium paronense]|uniref:Acyl-CoA reductase n=1 Tax=Flavobacterium paronense TaxID=1392775 RepID=A0ABV5GGV8_9FLAO|nr:acyl-CoA reductase [Flavobacterium paronense]MDN3675902.1 acyl-CoA reductase [Flavobacterium paronense]MDN3675913.1 acyl-CoA reductase [Flavobacterium paronense]MDN3677247.1 acyl-CoA reductase [Flavobacterium paronense]
MNSINTKLSFVELGKFLSQFTLAEQRKKNDVLHNDLYFDTFKDLLQLSQSHNGWFTTEQVYFAVQSWAEALTAENLNKWLSEYDLTEVKPKTVALILAGNIPLVGFHDFLSVLIAGHKVLVKASSNDQHLIQFLANYLISVEPKLSYYISFTDGKLENFDAIIATGSNNTARYFEFYFKDKPSIIRKNRNSVAVLNGNESHDDLVNLGEDIFRYFGLGCRNVSKLFVPKDYSFEGFFKAIYEYKDVIYYEKYSNNYDYNKAVFLMSNFKLLDNEFLTLKEDTSYASPISSVFYEYYEDIADLQMRLKSEAEKIQCVVSNDLIPNSISFGQTQQPKLWDYADNVDTLRFLASL